MIFFAGGKESYLIVVFVLDTYIHLTQLHFVGKKWRKPPAKQTQNCDFFFWFPAVNKLKWIIFATAKVEAVKREIF